MRTHFNEIETRLLSPKLWGDLAAPECMNPTGSGYTAPSGNRAFGFFDDFLTFSETTLVGPYANLKGTGCTISKVADTAAAKGILSMTLDGNADNDECVLKWGSTLSAPFYLANKDLAFECCLALSSITAAKHDIAIGLGQADMITTDLTFGDTSGLADKNFCGFVKLAAEAGVFDGAYKADGQTYQDGATKTKLNALATFTASVTTYIKLGFRFKATQRMLEFYVNGVVPGGNQAPARLTASELDAATFPDDTFLAPIIALKDQGGDTALNVQVDWWACAQYE